VGTKPHPPQLTSTGWMLNTNSEPSASSPHWEKKYLSTQFKQCINLRELPSADGPFPHMRCLRILPYEYLLCAVAFPSTSVQNPPFSTSFFPPGISREFRFPRTLRHRNASLVYVQYQPSAGVKLPPGSVAQQVFSIAVKATQARFLEGPAAPCWCGLPWSVKGAPPL